MTPPGRRAPRPLPPAAAEQALASSALLDAREERSFAAGHVRGAANVPADAFAARRAELPPRETAVLVLHASAGEARRAAEALAALGYADVAFLDAPLASLAGGEADRGPAACIWRPSPFLERVLPLLPPGRALDLAAGSGRESVTLALHGYVVEAWDHAPEALERAAALAARHGVSLETRVVDLEAGSLPAPATPWDVVVVCRFLHRPLFRWIERAVAPGGALVYETFRQGQEAFGRPTQPRFLLRPGELASAFPSLSVEQFEEVDPEGGPILSRLLARKPR